MAFKIYVENNHIVVQDLVSDKEFRAASKEAMFFKDRSSEDTYNTNGFFPEGLQGIKFVDIVDENETPFVNEQSFIDFFSANTGNFNSGGATPQTAYLKITHNSVVVEKNTINGATFEIDNKSTGNTSLAILINEVAETFENYHIQFTQFQNKNSGFWNLIDITKGLQLEFYQTFFDGSGPVLSNILNGTLTITKTN